MSAVGDLNRVNAAGGKYDLWNVNPLPERMRLNNAASRFFYGAILLSPCPITDFRVF